MKKLVFLVAAVLFVFFAFPTLASKVTKDAEEASHILIGEVADVQGYYDFNPWGDYLIFSKVKIKVEKELKGKAEKYVAFSVEGGAIGDMALYVSESPILEKGDRFKFYLKKTDGDFKFLSREDVRVGKAQGKPPACCKVFARWPTPYATYYINPTNGDMSDQCAIGDITSAAGLWGSAVTLDFLGQTDRQQVVYNGLNDVFFRPASSGSTIAATYIWYTRKDRLIVEFDMVFYDGGWRFFSSDCRQTCNTGFLLEVIAAHELGHAIGLDHNRCETSLMYPYASYCDTELLSADDLACALRLYGN